MNETEDLRIPAIFPQPGGSFRTRRIPWDARTHFSYLEFVGFRGDGMFSRVDLPSLGLMFQVPVFLVQGAEDLVTVPEVTRGYFEAIAAPRKEYVLVRRAGHDPNQATLDAVYAILLRETESRARWPVRPRTRGPVSPGSKSRGPVN